MRMVVQNGGNALRVWLMEEPSQSLVWHEDGRVDGLAQGVLRSVQMLLEMALHYDVHIVLVLFNGALARGPEACSLFTPHEGMLESLLANAITPLAHALRGYESLALWEVINEPEGLIDLARIAGDGSACTDARPVQQCARGGVSDDAPAADGVGWNPECRFELGAVQRFVNRVAGALRRADGGVHPLTLGAWSLCAAATDSATGAVNLWRDDCLVAAGGDADGFIDVLQAHAYPKEGGGASVGEAGASARRFSEASPLSRPASVFVGRGGGRVPVILGEVSSRWDGNQFEGGGGSTRRRALSSRPLARASRENASRPSPARASARRRLDQTPGGEPSEMARIYREAKRLGYAGVFSWAYTCEPEFDSGCVDHPRIAAGLRAGAEGIPGLTSRIDQPLPPRSRVGGIRACDCDGRDNMAGDYSCAQQVGWGKCALADVANACRAWCQNCGAGVRAIVAELPQRRCGLPPRIEPPPPEPSPPWPPEPSPPPPQAPWPLSPSPEPPSGAPPLSSPLPEAPTPPGMPSLANLAKLDTPAAMSGLPWAAQAGAGIALLALAFAGIGAGKRRLQRPCDPTRPASAPRPLSRGAKGRGTFVAHDDEGPPSAATEGSKKVKATTKAKTKGAKGLRKGGGAV